jgi:hypothetical protein
MWKLRVFHRGPTHADAERIDRFQRRADASANIWRDLVCLRLPVLLPSSSRSSPPPVPSESPPPPRPCRAPPRRLGGDGGGGLEAASTPVELLVIVAFHAELPVAVHVELPVAIHAEPPPPLPPRPHPLPAFPTQLAACGGPRRWHRRFRGVEAACHASAGGAHRGNERWRGNMPICAPAEAVPDDAHLHP